jgi:hypothetical protein
VGQKNAIPGKVLTNQPSSFLPPGLELMDQAVTGTNTYTSNVFNAANLDNIGLQVEFTGTMAGTLTVNCSIDNKVYIPLTFNPVLSQPAGSNLSYLIDLNQLPFPYLNIQYTNATGSGTLIVYLGAKDLN